MYQATESGWYATDEGAEVFIQKGSLRPDNHPDVKAVPALFERKSGGEPKTKARSKKGDES